MFPLLLSAAFAQEAPAEDELPPIVKFPELAEGGFVQAPYPEEAKQAGIEGIVVLLIEIDETGAVGYVEVLQSAGFGFDEAAAEAAKGFVFIPAEDTNGPTPVAIEFEYGFVLDAAGTDGAVPEEPLPDEPEQLPVTLEGSVIEMATQAKLPEMAVNVMGTEFNTVTDAEGRFALRGVPPGTHTLQVAKPGWATKTLEIEVVEGEVTEAQIWVRNENYDDAVVGVYRKNQDEITRRTISMTEVRRIPGTFGDPIRVIQNLPGAARSPFGTGLLIIRGANPEDTGVYVDGIRIPIIYHLGGYSSVLSPELIESVDYLPGGYGVQYGRTLGGAVDITTKREAPEQTHIAWSTDLLDSGGLYEGRLGSQGDHHVGVAARRSYVDLVIAPFQKNSLFIAKPRWQDYQLRYAYHGLENTTASVFVMGFDDRLLLSTPDDYAQGPDADAQGDISVHYYTHRIIGRVEHEFSPTLSMMVSPAVGWDFTAFGLGQAFQLEQLITMAEARAELNWHPNEHIELMPGVDFIGMTYTFQVELPVNPDSFDSYDPLAERENWGVGGEGSVWGPDVYLKANLKPFDDTDRLFIQPGIRYSYVNVVGQYHTSGVDPRIAGRLRVLPRTYLKAAAGIYTQPPQPTESWQPEGNYTLAMEKQRAYSLGFEQQVTGAIHADVDAFYKDLYDLIVFNPDWGSIQDNAYVNLGTGTVYGVEFMVRHDPVDRLFGWVSYTYSRSFRQDYADSDEYAFDFDQPHILTALAGYKLPYQFEVSGRFQYVTGNPYTPYSGAVYDADLDLWNAYSTGKRNSDRLGAYQALDLRVERSFTFKKGRMLLYADFLNVYKGENPEFRLYNYDYTEYVDVGGLPFVPSPGIELEFYL